MLQFKTEEVPVEGLAVRYLKAFPKNSEKFVFDMSLTDILEYEIKNASMSERSAVLVPTSGIRTCMQITRVGLVFASSDVRVAYKGDCMSYKSPDGNLIASELSWDSFESGLQEYNECFLKRGVAPLAVYICKTVICNPCYDGYDNPDMYLTRALSGAEREEVIAFAGNYNLPVIETQEELNKLLNQ